MTIDETILRAAHDSLAIRWVAPDVPFAISGIRGEKVGFAQDPCVVLDVDCRPEHVSSIVPIVRQRLFSELSERGWENELVEFTPGVAQQRRRKFKDENEASGTCGQNRFGHHHEFRFRMLPELAKATFQGFGSFKPIPDR